MDIKELIKKPIVVANLLILVCFIFLPYFSFSMTGFYGAGTSVTETGFGLFWSIFDNFHFLNFILIAVPAANIFILYKVWKKEEANFMLFKFIIFAVLFLVFLNIAFFAEKSSIKFVGFGLWVSLIIAGLQMFESKVVEFINKQLPEDKKIKE